jgi:hypothetical protein
MLSLSTNLPKSCSFRLENHWLKQTTFLQSVLVSWDQAPTSSDAAGQLVACIKATRASAKVWSRCNRAPPTLTQNCQFIVQLFDYFEESRPLTPAEFQARHTTQERLQELIKEKAAYWKQRSKQKAIRESDANTAYHHANATQQLRRNYIRLLRVDQQDVTSHSAKTEALTSYFKSIIGVSGISSVADLTRLYSTSAQPSNALVSAFTEEETKAAILAMNSNSAPGPNGFGPAFYKWTWPRVKSKIMEFMHAFHRGEAQLERINRSHMVLLPKKAAVVEVFFF